MERERGTGHIYKHGNTYWMQYYINGERYQENTHEKTEQRAEAVLQRTLADVASGKLRDPHAERSKMRVLVEDLFKKKRTGLIRGDKSLEQDEYRWKKNLEPVFGHLKAQQITKRVVDKYVAARKEAKAQNGTINKEISILRRAFREAEIIGPRWPRLPEENIRTGYLEDAQYAKLADECGSIGLWLRVLLALGASYGWRRGEMTGLRVRQVDLLEGTITLDPGTTKNREGRVVAITDELVPLLKAACEGKQPDDYVLSIETEDDDGKVKHAPVGDFRKTWATVCKAAGVPALKVHDLRRTAARNLRRLGVDETVIMRLGGWKTAHVFKRYNIVSTDDMKDATRLLNAKRNGERLQDDDKTASEQQQPNSNRKQVAAKATQ